MSDVDNTVKDDELTMETELELEDNILSQAPDAEPGSTETDKVELQEVNDTDVGTNTNDAEMTDTAELQNEEETVEPGDGDLKGDEVKEVFDISDEHHFEDNDEGVEGIEGVDIPQDDKMQDEEKDSAEVSKLIDEDDEEEEDEDMEDPHLSSSDPNVMPQVNVTVLARK